MKGVPELKKKRNLLALLALILGAVVYKICSKILDKVCSSVWGLKRLTSTDEFFVQNGREGGKDSHVLIWLKVHKRPYEVLKTWARDHFGKFKKCRVMLTQAFGHLYWKQLSDA